MLLQQVTHGAIQFTAYEELRKAVVEFRSADSEEDSSAVELLVTLYFYYSINFDTNSKYSFFSIRILSLVVHTATVFYIFVNV